MNDNRITPAILQTLASVQYDEGAQHERATSAKRLVRDDITDGRIPDQRLISISLACACPACCDATVEWATELGRWLDAAQHSPPSLVERFVAECCDLTNGGTSDTTPAEFYEAYLSWARASGENPAAVTVIGVGRELSARLGIRSTAVRGIRTYKGLALLHSPIDPATAPDIRRSETVAGDTPS
jgi:hypothetical protein